MPLVLVYQVESLAECGSVLTIQRTYGVLLESIQGSRRRDRHANTVELLDLGFDRLEGRRFTKAGHHVEEEIGVWRIVPNGRVFSQQVSRTDVVDVGVASVSRAQRLAKAFDVLSRCANEQIDVLGNWSFWNDADQRL
jgi:hypothetical protein